MVSRVPSAPLSPTEALRQAAREAFDQAGTSDALQGTPLPMIDLDIIANR